MCEINKENKTMKNDGVINGIFLLLIKLPTLIPVLARIDF